MVLTDGIADMLTRIRNALMVRHEFVDIPYSKIKESIGEILKKEGFVSEIKAFTEKKPGVLRVYLKYDPDKRGVIRGLKRISKPGRRVYAGADELPRVMGGIGIAMISTNRGVITDKEARSLRIGGEVLCFIW